jgi:pSer/pThr/pTyr-binding forkhead associated (FHA) protein
MSDSRPVFVDVAAGHFVFREGDSGSEMYIIETGCVEVLRAGRSEPVAALGPGDFFGEMAILEDQPRFASVRATSAARLLKVDRAAFAGMLRENFEIAVRIMRKLVSRLRRTEEQLSEAQRELARARGKGPTTAPGAIRPAAVAAPPKRPAPVPAQALGKALKLVHGDSGSEFSLATGRAEMMVGRPDPVTGLLPDINLGPLDQTRSLSRRHAKVIDEGGILFLREEVGTTNGTFVNGERLQTGQARPLAPGDQIRFGSVELRVEAL